MKILFYVPSPSQRLETERFVSMLRDGIGTVFACEITDQLPSTIPPGTLVHMIGANTSSHLKALSRLSHQACVVSTLGTMRLLSEKIPLFNRLHIERRLVKKIVRLSPVLHVQGLGEWSVIERLRLQQKTVRIPNAVTSSTINPAEMVAKMKNVYRETANTFPILMLDRNELEAMTACLHVALEGNIIMLPDDRRTAIQNIEKTQWTYLMLHARDEGVDDLLLRGLQMLDLDLDIASLSSEKIVRFISPSPIEHLSDKELLSTNIMIGSKLDEFSPTEDANELAVITIFLNLKYLVLQSRIAWQHLTFLYERLRWTPIDEDKLAIMARRMKITTFIRRLMAVMSRSLLLPDGFMPLPPLSDRQSAQILNNIYYTKRH